MLGADIYLEKERTYRNWYHITYADESGDGEKEGYVCADYVVVTGELTDDHPDDPPAPPELETDYRTDDAYIWMVSAGTTVGVFRSRLSLDSRVLSPDGTERNDAEPVRTGDVAVLTDGTEEIGRRTVAVMRDVDGDGTVNVRDYAQVKRVCLGSWRLEGVFLLAGSFSEPFSINAQDYMKVKRIALGTYSIEPSL
ncbi:MAG: hypothetical protein ILO68_06260 [Clostridia bacterium]|nr:hypothetical protein [Clostridia bacterium]